MSKPTTKALATLSNLRPLAVVGEDKLPTLGNLDSLFAKANEQYAAIKQGDRTTALRALFLGLVFWQIKNECPHGQFMKLANERMPSIPRQTRQDYMKLSMVYVDRTKLALPGHFEIPDAQIALSLGDGNGTEREMVTKAVSFIGDLSLHELMIKHGIRAVGLKTELDDQNSEPAPPTANEAEQFFAKVAENLYGIRTFATDATSIMRLTPEQLDTVDQTMTDTYSQWKRHYDEARSAKKAS